MSNAWSTEALNTPMVDLITSRKSYDTKLPKLPTPSPTLSKSLTEQGITVRIGDKLVKLQVTGEEILPVDEIKAEYEVIMEKRLGDIQKDFDVKVKEITYMSDMTRKELERKEKTLTDKLKNVKSMPEISWEHAKAGLSVVRGASEGELHWIYQSVYWPKFVDERPISAAYQKKMITPMTIVVSTKGDRVTGVICRKSIGLEKFDHYHNQISNDCWGVWQWKPTWSTPKDIINVCKEATAVLENINGNSLAQRSPSGLPTYAAVRKNSTSKGDTVVTTLSKNDERTGILDAPERDEVTGGSWST